MMDGEIQILIVDDESSVRTVLSEVLEEDGFKVTQATSGTHALEIMAENEFALVITDINMPGISGLELLEEVKEKASETEVIIITSFASLDTAVTALRLGAYDYLFKPFEDLELISAAAKRATEKVRLLSENKILLGKLKKKNSDLETAYNKLKVLATRDGLTGLYNHRYFQELLQNEVMQANPLEDVFTLLFMDLDHFKSYNDTHGHPEGDKLLRTLSKILFKGLRKTDVIARYGGEEFVVILPETPRENGRIVAEKIRRYIESYKFYGRDTQPLGKITVSIGLATFPLDGIDKTDLIKTADAALYRAKAGSRNCVCMSEPAEAKVSNA